MTTGNFRFLDWEVYKSSKSLFPIILQVVKKLPKEYRFELGSQVIRSSFSITLNIAEGSGKNSDKELNRFINIALGSVNETVAAIDILRDNSLIEAPDFNFLLEYLTSVARQLGGFKKSLIKRRSIVNHQ